ncbi:carboxypeptidase [Paenibacillus yanchengensis]|uniref:Carboxypeptidase n=1 Tax=Paenibacillus yanchengensis TaxID=2035833 RepID=A0ABW4YKY6_9BACL
MDTQKYPRRGTDSARVIRVIETKAARGLGTEEDPMRVVIQYWSFDGRLLAENDSK